MRYRRPHGVATRAFGSFLLGEAWVKSLDIILTIGSCEYSPLDGLAIVGMNEGHHGSESRGNAQDLEYLTTALDRDGRSRVVNFSLKNSVCVRIIIGCRMK